MSVSDLKTTTMTNKPMRTKVLMTIALLCAVAQGGMGRERDVQRALMGCHDQTGGHHRHYQGLHRADG